MRGLELAYHDGGVGDVRSGDGVGNGLFDLGTEKVQRIFGLSETLIKPVIKCVAVAIITKMTADLCKDSSQAAAASAVELAGTVCALCIIMPLLMSMLTAIGGMI